MHAIDTFSPLLAGLQHPIPFSINASMENQNARAHHYYRPRLDLLITYSTSYQAEERKRSDDVSAHQNA